MDDKTTRAHSWIGVDLDGTLAEHYWPSKGPYHHERIGDPIPAMRDRVLRWLEQGKNVKIFTARVSHAENGHDGIGPVPEARAAIERWCLFHLGKVLPVTCVKDYNMVALYDDRARQVEHNTGRVIVDDRQPHAIVPSAEDRQCYHPDVYSFGLQCTCRQFHAADKDSTNAS